MFGQKAKWVLLIKPNTMDKEKIGAFVVDEIIGRYKASKEFEKDAIGFVRQNIDNEINAVCANAGLKFSNGDVNDVEKQNELTQVVEKCHNQKEMVKQIFEQVFGDNVPKFRP